MRTRHSLRVGTKKEHFTFRFVSFVTLVLIFGVTMLTVNHAQQLDLTTRALLYAAQLNNLPLDRLVIVNTTWLTQQIYRAKVLDKAMGDIYPVNLRSSGELATEEEVASLLRSEREKGFVGKVEARLKGQADAAPTASSRINIWVKTPPVPRGAWHSGIVHDNRQQVFAQAAAFHTQAEAPVLQFLHNLGIREKYASPHAPVITCEIPNRFLAQLAGLPEVLRIYADEVPVPLLNTSIPTIKAQRVWNQGTTGSGVKMATIEAQELNGTNAIANDNPFVGPVTYYDLAHTQSGGHATEVAGVIASTDATYRGVSHGVGRPADLLNGNPGSSSCSALNAATSWAVGQGASVINQSYGLDPPPPNISECGIYDDYIVDLYLVTIIAGSGNSSIARVTDPADAYNVIAVGAFDHSSTSTWSDDVMAGYSSFMNPGCPNFCREKPEIAAPGNVYTTFEVSPWVPLFAAGTSFAAPHAAGTAALLMQAKPSLKTRPEEVKAILMSSAIHNIEGASRLSDQDGAGGLQAKAAYDTVFNGWSSKISYDFCQAYCSTVYFNATAGQIVRFVINWLSQSDGTSVDSATDMSLVVKNPDGSVAATSDSFYDNFEIVEFTATQTGTYTAKGCHVCPCIPEIACPIFGWAYNLQ